MKPGSRILLVEDDVDIAEAMIDVLVDQGYLVAHAHDGLEALELLRGSPAPGVILLDLMMPTMDGMQFREAQLSEPSFAAIPVIVLSADRRIAETARQLGVRHFAPKPLRAEQLLSLVEGVECAECLEGGLSA